MASQIFTARDNRQFEVLADKKMRFRESPDSPWINSSIESDTPLLDLHGSLYLIETKSLDVYSYSSELHDWQKIEIAQLASNGDWLVTVPEGRIYAFRIWKQGEHRSWGDTGGATMLPMFDVGGRNIHQVDKDNGITFFYNTGSGHWSPSDLAMQAVNGDWLAPDQHGRIYAYHVWKFGEKRKWGDTGGATLLPLFDAGGRNIHQVDKDNRNVFYYNTRSGNWNMAYLAMQSVNGDWLAPDQYGRIHAYRVWKPGEKPMWGDTGGATSLPLFNIGNRNIHQVDKDTSTVLFYNTTGGNWSPADVAMESINGDWLAPDQHGRIHAFRTWTGGANSDWGDTGGATLLPLFDIGNRNIHQVDKDSNTVFFYNTSDGHWSPADVATRSANGDWLAPDQYGRIYALRRWTSGTSPKWGDSGGATLLPLFDAGAGNIHQVDKDDSTTFFYNTASGHWSPTGLAKKSPNGDLIAPDQFGRNFIFNSATRNWYLEPKQVEANKVVGRELKVGVPPVSVYESKVEWEGGGVIKYPVVYHRRSYVAVYVIFNAPEDIFNDAWGDIRKCAFFATAAAGIAFIVASPDAALATFKEAFTSCLVAKIADRANKINVDFDIRQEATDWQRV